MIFEQLKGIIAEELGVDESDVTLDANLTNDLGADSLDAVELIMALEDEFDLEISDEKAQSLTTVKAIVDYIEKNK
ncbi:MAG: acyl carrier protein [Candidatus Izimaplasma sp.]|nr:acyl carrier protein [Candidatus Izimaplasma bacterium]